MKCAATSCMLNTHHLSAVVQPAVVEQLKKLTAVHRRASGIKDSTETTNWAIQATNWAIQATNWAIQATNWAIQATNWVIQATNCSAIQAGN